jgi:hypothetical protein
MVMNGLWRTTEMTTLNLTERQITILAIALIWNNVNLTNKIRKSNEEIDKIVERIRKDT